MDGQRFDTITRALGGGASRRRIVGGFLAAAVAGLRPGRLLAGDDTVLVGNGGFATASADGGTFVIGDINTGGNRGNTVNVGNTWGNVWVDGGDVSNSTTIDLSADGGTAIADASGGSNNIAVLSGDRDDRVRREDCNCNACWSDEYCCNWSCGICAPRGGACTDRYCNYCYVY